MKRIATALAVIALFATTGCAASAEPAELDYAGEDGRTERAAYDGGVTHGPIITIKPKG